MKVFKSHQSQEDLIDIWVGIYPESEAAANRLLDQIEAKRSLLPFLKWAPRETISVPDSGC